MKSTVVNEYCDRVNNVTGSGLRMVCFGSSPSIDGLDTNMVRSRYE